MRYNIYTVKDIVQHVFDSNDPRLLSNLELFCDEVKDQYANIPESAESRAERDMNDLLAELADEEERQRKRDRARIISEAVIENRKHA